MLLYIYTWEYNRSSGIIDAYGLDKQNNTVRLSLEGFKPYFYVEVPNNVSPQYIIDTLSRKIFRGKEPDFNVVDCKHLYYASKQSEKIKCIRYSYFNNSPFYNWRYDIEKNCKLQVHEHNVPPILQFVCERNLQTTGWMNWKNDKLTGDIHCLEMNDSDSPPPSPVILSFDIEVYSSIPNRFPRASVKEDCIFQISCVFWRRNGFNRTYLIVIGDVDKTQLEDTIAICVKTEEQLLIEFAKLIKFENPNMITGWNIMGFDIEYIMKRSEIYHLDKEFSKLGVSGRECQSIRKSWASSAYGEQNYCYYDWDGRVVIDLLVYARREIKSENYKLNTIASRYIQTHKDPLTAKDIFEAYRACVLEERKEGVQLMTTCGIYCVKDSILVQRLFEKWDIWIGSTEMANVCNVSMSTLFTNGQQVKVYSQVYRYCHERNIVIQSDAYTCKENEQYQGAYVKDPIPGIYDYVVPFDFSSLYPTLIVAYNIDYSTFVIDESIPDERCNVIEWTEEHTYDMHQCPKCNAIVRGERSDSHNKYIGDEYDYQLKCESCGKQSMMTIDDYRTYPNATIRKSKVKLPTKDYTDSYRYRFLKEPKGVLPSIIVNLLDARARVRQQMKKLKSSSNRDDIMIGILNQRQLSYKVSANSMYGSLGVRKGMLPLMPGAMCVTAMGRYSLHRAAQHLVERYGVNWVYSDTDSTYVQFPGVPPDQIWKHAQKIEQEMLDEKIFPTPMALKFEEAIYHPFFILSKKRYMWKYYGSDSSKGIGNKGVILARRGSSKFLHSLYESVVQLIFSLKSKEEVQMFILEELNKCCSGLISADNFTLSKSVNSQESYAPDRPLPAHVQLADTIRDRGTQVNDGERIEYVITTRGGLKAKLDVKVEEFSFQRKHASRIRIDYLYYVHLTVGQIDELLKVAFRVDDFVSKQYEWRLQKQKIMNEIRGLFEPKFPTFKSPKQKKQPNKISSYFKTQVKE